MCATALVLAQRICFRIFLPVFFPISTSVDNWLFFVISIQVIPQPATAAVCDWASIHNVCPVCFGTSLERGYPRKQSAPCQYLYNCAAYFSKKKNKQVPECSLNLLSSALMGDHLLKTL